MSTIKKILDILTQDEKKRLYFLFILILLMAILDTLGIASILPFIAVLSDQNLIETNGALKEFYIFSKHVGVTNANQFLFLLGVISFFFLIISLLIKIITTYLQTRFCYMREYTISKRLLEGYLQQPYTWFLQKNSSDLGKNILAEVNKVINYAAIPMMNFIAQSAVVVAITILLFIAEPFLTLIFGLILVISFTLIFLFTKNTIKRLGSENLKENTNRFEIVSEAFGAVKEIKVKGLEKFYTKKFMKPAKIYATNESLASIIGLLPRYLIEGVSFGILISMVLILIYTGREFGSIIPSISLFAIAGYRLLPSLQQIFFAISRIRFVSQHLETLREDLLNLSNSNEISKVTNKILLKNEINLSNISFHYPNSEKMVLKNLNILIKASSKVGIVGTTGSGKTTLVDIIIGLIDPSNGKLSVDKNIIRSENKRLWQKNIGYVPQNVYLSDRSILSNIAFGVDEEKIDFKEVEKASKSANLHDFIIEELPEKYNTIVGERGIRLSGGQCQRLGIARALYKKPQVLIFDEATSALDNKTENIVMESINQLNNNITVIMIAHRLTTVKKCDKIFLLEDGEVIAKGTFEELKKYNKTFQEFTKDVN